MNQADDLGSKHIPKIFVVCNQSDITLVWSKILRQEGLTFILESIVDKAVDRIGSDML